MLRVLGGGVLVLVVVVLIRAALLRPPPVQRHPALDLPPVDAAAVANRMSAVVQQATVSLRTHGGDLNPTADPTTFVGLRATLARLYPRVHAELECEQISEHSLLFTWRGTEPGLPPMLMAAHTDVVPVEPGTESSWAYPPFGGVVAEGFIWGRGTIDDKLGVVGGLEAIEHLLEAGVKPRRTVLLALGHDEEVGGEQGAQVIAQTLSSRGVRPWFVLDEGGLVIQGALPGVEPPVALVGISEKGYASVELSIHGEGGHSTMPNPPGNIAVLALAVARLESNRFSPRISAPTGAMLDHIAPHASFGMRIALANRWLFDPVIARALTLDPSSNAAVRTTTAATMFEAGVADNVLAASATAIVNFRILPGETVEDVMVHVHNVIGDPRIEVACLGRCWEPSPVSPLDEEPFAILRRTIEREFEGTVVAPYLVVGGTDARYYHPMTLAGGFRFMPVRFEPDDRARLHGTNERLGVEALAQAVRFYMAFILDAAVN